MIQRLSLGSEGDMTLTLLLLTCCILPWLFRWDGHKHLASVEILLPSHVTPEDGLRDIQVQGDAELCVGRASRQLKVQKSLCATSEGKKNFLLR